MARIVLLLFTVMLFCGCLTQRKREDVTYRYLREHPDILARLSAEKYPVKERLIKGKPDTVYVEGAGAVLWKPGKPGRPPRAIPPTDSIDREPIYLYIRQTDTLIQESTALADSLRIALGREQEARIKAETSASTWKRIASNRMGWIIGLAVLFGGSLFGLIGTYWKNLGSWIGGILKRP